MLLKLRIINQIKQNIEQGITQGELKTEKDIRDTVKNIIDQKTQILLKNKYSYDNLLKSRERVAYRLSRFSPMALFQFSLETIAGTGLKFTRA